MDFNRIFQVLFDIPNLGMILLGFIISYAAFKMIEGFVKFVVIGIAVIFVLGWLASHGLILL